MPSLSAYFASAPVAARGLVTARTGSGLWLVRTGLARVAARNGTGRDLVAGMSVVLDTAQTPPVITAIVARTAASAGTEVVVDG